MIGKLILLAIAALSGSGAATAQPAEKTRLSKMTFWTIIVK